MLSRSMDTIKRLGGHTNSVLLQLPERHHPSVALQQDSLQNLKALVLCLDAAHDSADEDEFKGLVEELCGLLDGYLAPFGVND